MFVRNCEALGLGVMDLYWGGQGDEYPKIADEVAEGREK